MKRTRRRIAVVCRILLTGAGLLSLQMSAKADAIADFYRGKSISLLIGVAVGGEYDTVGRLVARHIGAHIPGNPNVVPQNMIGASGLKMANHLYAVAPQDGTYIGAMSNELPMNDALGAPGIQFESAKFHWIGSISPLVETLVVRSTSGIRTLDDARQREVTVGTPTKTSIHNFLVGILNRYAGTKFRMVTGYTGGNATDLAMERGEVDGRVVAWSAIKVTKADWLKEGKINELAQFGPPAPDLPHVPTATSLARNDTERKVVDLLTSPTLLGRPLAVGPGVPDARVAALRTAFEQMVTDPAFLSDANILHVEVAIVRGQDMQEIVSQVLNTPKDIIAQAKKFNE